MGGASQHENNNIEQVNIKYNQIVSYKDNSLIQYNYRPTVSYKHTYMGVHISFYELCINERGHFFVKKIAKKL